MEHLEGDPRHEDRREPGRHGLSEPPFDRAWRDGTRDHEVLPAPRTIGEGAELVTERAPLDGDPAQAGGGGEENGGKQRVRGRGHGAAQYTIERAGEGSATGPVGARLQPAGGSPRAIRSAPGSVVVVTSFGSVADRPGRGRDLVRVGRRSTRAG